MQIDTNARYAVGVDLGGTNVRASVVETSGRILAEARLDSRAMAGFDATVGQIVAAVKTALEAAAANLDRVAGIGMGVPGTIKPEGRRCRVVAQL